MNDTMVALVMAECSGPVQRCDGDLKAKLRAAMDAAKDHWMVLDRQEQFRGALGAIMQHYGKDSPEWRRISLELAKIRQLNAFIAAAQAGLNPSLPAQDEQFEPLGLIGMWHEITGESA